MKIVNDELTASYRKRGPCRWCGKKVNLCGAHIFAKGMAGGSQIDIPCNLVSLGMDALYDCSCHASHHDGNDPLHCDLLAVSAADNDCSQLDIENLVMLIRRMPRIKEVSEDLFLYAVEVDLKRRPSAQKLARRELETFKHLLRTP